MISTRSNRARLASFSRWARGARPFAVLALAALAAGPGALGCGDGEPAAALSRAPSGSPPPRPGPTGTTSAAAGGPTSAPTDQAPSPEPQGPFTGRWKGSYRSERVKPTLDPTVKDAVWKDDDGKRHTGTGAIELTVKADGTTTGTLTGSLGSADVNGESDVQSLRAMITSTVEGGPSGTLIGKLHEKGLAIEIRTSDGEGKAPRIAHGTLEKVR